MGATPACSFDNLREIGEVAHEFGMWHHVDAAYAGEWHCDELVMNENFLDLFERYRTQPLLKKRKFNQNETKLLHSEVQENVMMNW